MLRYCLFLVLLFAVSGCATKYRPPKEPPPASWSGVSGMIPVLDNLSISEGDKGEDAVLVEYGTRFRRTGVIAETVETATAYGGTMTLPKGAPVYAANYSLYVTSTYSGSRSAQGQYDPIEWCAVLAKGTNGKKDKPEVVCLFWENDTTVRYMKGYGSFPYAPFLGGASGMPGPVPVINEQKVDFGVILSRQLRIRKIRGKRVDLHWGLTDGTNFRPQERVRAPWGEDGSAIASTLFGKFKFTRIAEDDNTAVKVEFIPRS